MKFVRKDLSKNQLASVEYLLIVIISVLPVFFNFPYRVNIFLSWEGAYRLYLGQIPYRDFGLPMGFAYWVIPALFFKIFGPYLITLVKAQAFINILSGLAFSSILKSLQVNAGQRMLCILLFCLSYSFFNFWPWYNHSVIVFELIAVSFLMKYIFLESSRWRYVFIVLSCLFLIISIFTKQDAGGMAVLICGTIVLYYSLFTRSVLPIGTFIVSFVVLGALLVLPFIQYDFLYWFNYGQEPHNSRINLMDIATAIMASSMWEKFYLCLILIINFSRWSSWKELYQDKAESVFLLLTVGIIVQALIFQVTSYTPPDNNIFFHSFAIAYILAHSTFNLKFSNAGVIAGFSLLILVWWSGVYWKYTERIVARIIPESYKKQDPNKISRSTYIISKDTANINMAEWKFSSLSVFKGIYMPEPTIQGIDRLMQMPEIKNNASPKVLNMTELTPLAYAMHYTFAKSQPLWYHKGVGIFQREVNVFCEKIKAKEYDVVLFETVPYLNNFYPSEVRDCLIQNYRLKDRFIAPRRPTDSHIEVFIRP